jgi:hypothetical protein
MDRPKTPLKATRSYAPNQKAFDRLEAVGVNPRHIYRGWTDEETFGKFTMRTGEYLGVVDGLKAFGKTKRPALAAIKLVHSWGATILDVETGKDSRSNGADMLDEIIKPPKPSPEYLAKVAEERKAKWREKNGVMPAREAFQIWKHPKMSVAEKLDLMHGWTKQAAYNEFKKTGAPAGRRTKDSVAPDPDMPVPVVTARRRRPTHGFVYFMRINNRGHVKIGYSTDVMNRFKAHGISNPGEPVLVGSMHGTRTTEKRLHKKYADLHVKGEWFRYTGALKAFIEALPEAI